MPIEKRPAKNLPPNYVPSGGMPYKVKTNDDWASIARQHGITEDELVHFNFGTIHPAEVNWYLRQNVGCNRPTRDLKNWMFTSDAHPGIIYLPPKLGWKRPVPSATTTSTSAPEAAPARSGVWFGLGAAEGGILALGGAGTTQAWMFSLESFQDRFWMSVQSYRVGLGLGSSVGAVFVLVTGVQTPGDLQHYKIDGKVDFQVDFGPKWGDLAKTLKNLKFIRNLEQGTRGAKFLEKTLSPKQWKDLGETIKKIMDEREPYGAAKEMNEMSRKVREGEKTITVIPLSIIPGAGELVGIGLELSVYYQWGIVSVY
ncbi:MAG: LysM domain-containing protein [Candidatus Acidiferrum sp.]